MHRTIKSFVIRAGRMSPRQQLGLDQYLPAYHIPYKEELCDFNKIFNRSAPLVIEIGFGMGASFLTMAQAQPEINFVGIEVHRAGIGSLAADLHDNNIENVRIIPHDAVEVLNQQIPDASLDGVQIFFPDPWPKKRHHKRRLIQTPLVKLIASKLKPGGFIHCATDWEEYAQHILAVLNAEPLLSNSQQDGSCTPRPNSRPLTKFEQRGTRLGHGVWDMIFLKR